MRSGWLEAPISGGQSWMSHATLATGLWIPDQSTYDAALISGRRSLFHLARRNGFETVAVMPAITMEWPEADLMGFDRVHAAENLGYAGLPFNWVTMPDQFTLTALERLVLAGEPGRDRPPVFAQVALISSHAPWTPVPDLVAWDDIGDGRIFDAVSQSGDPPEVVWRDRDRVRDQFRKAIDYSLGTVGAFAARHAGAPPLLIVLGDHQPAHFVSGDDGLAVPIHVIGPKDLVGRFADWEWTRGMIPDHSVPVIRMDSVPQPVPRHLQQRGPRPLTAPATNPSLPGARGVRQGAAGRRAGAADPCATGTASPGPDARRRPSLAQAGASATARLHSARPRLTSPKERPDSRDHRAQTPKACRRHDPTYRALHVLVPLALVIVSSCPRWGQTTSCRACGRRSRAGSWRPSAACSAQTLLSALRWRLTAVAAGGPHVARRRRVGILPVEPRQHDGAGRHGRRRRPGRPDARQRRASNGRRRPW